MLVRTRNILGIFSVLLFAVSTPCQNEIIEIQEPFEAQALAGQVRVGEDPNGVKGVLAERCTSDWKSVLESTYTDEKEHFNFPKASRRKLHYLRLSFRGAHTLRVKVKITRSGTKKLSLTLEFAT